MDASDIITEVSTQLNDVGKVTWTEPSLIEYINSAQEMIVLIRPDAFSQITTMQMVAGTKQALPVTALRLLDIKRNMGSDGNTPGRAVIAVDESSLDLFAFNWHTSNNAAEIKNFTYDEKTPNTFYVDPPSNGNGHIEISVSRVPTKIIAPANSLVLKDIYRNPVVQWCMFRAYSIEVDSRSSRDRALKHEKTFYQMMGEKFQRDIVFSPSPEAAESG